MEKAAEFRKLTIVDSAGKPRIVMRVEEDLDPLCEGPVLELLDRQGLPRASFMVNDTGASLDLADDTARPVGGLHQQCRCVRLIINGNPLIEPQRQSAHRIRPRRGDLSG